MGQLRSTGLVAAAAEPAPVLRPGLVEYLTFLREHRGFCEATIERHGLYVGRFLDEVGARTEADLRGLPIERVDRFLVGASRLSKRLSMGAICSSVRGFLPAAVRALPPEAARAACEGARSIGLLAFDDPGAGALLADIAGVRVVERVLTPSGRLEEAARNLFRSMRELDGAGVDHLCAEPPPTSSGVGQAILDRLQRASARRA